MKLASISVKNYRSLKSTPKIRIDNLSIFIGENNSGKSNLINAIKIALENGWIDKDQAKVAWQTFMKDIIGLDIKTISEKEIEDETI